MKKTVFLLIFLIIAASFVSAEQIAKIGIINYSKIVSAYSGDSRSLQEIERMIKNYEDGVSSIKDDIYKLQERKLYYQNSNDDISALRIEEQIEKKKNYLKEYSRLRLSKIENKKSSLIQSTEFLSKILEKIEYIAESEGYSIIFNSKDPNIIWWSQTVDITDLVIERLKNSR